MSAVGIRTLQVKAKPGARLKLVQIHPA